MARQCRVGGRQRHGRGAVGSRRPDRLRRAPLGHEGDRNVALPRRRVAPPTLRLLFCTSSMRWQKRARLGIAIFGIAFAAVVFFAIRKREEPVAATAVTRTDPSAIIETSGCVLQSITGTRKNFTVTCDRQLAYESGDIKMFGVRVEIKERQGRDFAITGTEALANEKSRQ